MTVYCRRQPGEAAAAGDAYLGMRLVHLPAMQRKSLETLSHTALSVLHLIRHGGADAVIVFNAANAVFLPLLRLRRLPVATHVDGLEWRRAKWGPVGQRYYRIAEALSVRWSDALIADARGISDYYLEEFGADRPRSPTVHRCSGHSVPSGWPSSVSSRAAYHLVVARFEPENHVDVAIEGYLHSHAGRPLVVVGSAPYPGAHQRRIDDLASRHDGVRLLGGIWDQEQLDQLYANALTYVHGHSVGGTNPSLLRAMGAGSAVIAYDVNFNRDVLGPDGCFFADAEELAKRLDRAEHGAGECSEPVAVWPSALAPSTPGTASPTTTRRCARAWPTVAASEGPTPGAGRRPRPGVQSAETVWRTTLTRAGTPRKG